jgi:hypothetical protein
MRKILATFCALAILATAGSAFAVSGDILATANVLQPLTVSNNLRDLDFGDVFPGIAKSILYSDATSGKWSIVGELGKEVDLSFTLPANLQSGVNLLPISFGGADAAWHTADAVGSATAFDPAAGATEFLDAATGEMWAWIGGTVTPAGAQPAGVYTANITLDVVYTGN